MYCGVAALAGAAESKVGMDPYSILVSFSRTVPSQFIQVTVYLFTDWVNTAVYVVLLVTGVIAGDQLENVYVY